MSVYCTKDGLPSRSMLELQAKRDAAARYWIKPEGGIWKETDMQGYISAEKSADDFGGFRSRFEGRPATSSFSGPNGRGRITYGESDFKIWNDDSEFLLVAQVNAN